MGFHGVTNADNVGSLITTGITSSQTPDFSVGITSGSGAAFALVPVPFYVTFASATETEQSTNSSVETCEVSAVVGDTLTISARALNGTTGQEWVSGSKVQIRTTGLLWKELQDQVGGDQSANRVYVGPATGSPAQPAFRLLVPNDIPNIDTLNGTLDIASGGTGSTVQSWVDLTTAQTVVGVKTFRGNGSLPSVTVTTGELRLGESTVYTGSLLFAHASNSLTAGITSAAMAVGRTYTLPDVSADANFVMTQGAQTLAGLKTFTGGLAITTADLTITDRNVVLGTTTGSQMATATAQKLAFHGSTPVIQRAGADQVAVATTGATSSTPFGYTTAAQANALVALVNEIRAVLTEKGIMKGSS